MNVWTKRFDSFCEIFFQTQKFESHGSTINRYCAVVNLSNLAAAFSTSVQTFVKFHGRVQLLAQPVCLYRPDNFPSLVFDAFHSFHDFFIFFFSNPKVREPRFHNKEILCGGQSLKLNFPSLVFDAFHFIRIICYAISEDISM